MAIARIVATTAAVVGGLLLPSTSHASAGDPPARLTIETTRITETRYATHCNYVLVGVVNPAFPLRVTALHFFDWDAHSFNSTPMQPVDQYGVAKILWQPLAAGQHHLEVDVTGDGFAVAGDTQIVNVTDTSCSVVDRTRPVIPHLPPFEPVPQPGPIRPGPLG